MDGEAEKAHIVEAIKCAEGVGRRELRPMHGHALREQAAGAAFESAQGRRDVGPQEAVHLVARPASGHGRGQGVAMLLLRPT